jgi:LysR family hydrogen peroxide-inducible transcriptional activator
MVASGIGISVLPRTSASDNASADQLIRYIPFEDPIPTRRVCLVWRKNFPRAAAMNELAEVIRQCALPGVQYL